MQRAHRTSACNASNEIEGLRFPGAADRKIDLRANDDYPRGLLRWSLKSDGTPGGDFHLGKNSRPGGNADGGNCLIAKRGARITIESVDGGGGLRFCGKPCEQIWWINPAVISGWREFQVELSYTSRRRASDGWERGSNELQDPFACTRNLPIRRHARRSIAPR